MDGNNRYSKKKDISLYDSYSLGAKKIINLSNFIFNNFNTKIISAFGLSNNNTKRSDRLIKVLIKVLEQFLDDNNFNYKINFNIIFKGDLSFFSKKTNLKIKNFQKQNNKHSKSLVIYLNYSGRIDIIKAATKYNFRKIDNNKFRLLLSTMEFPDPDILIRTGGYNRISDFFLFQISFTELFFIKKLWPELSRSDIKNIISKFSNIRRKFGF